MANVAKATLCLCLTAAAQLSGRPFKVCPEDTWEGYSGDRSILPCISKCGKCTCRDRSEAGCRSPSQSLRTSPLLLPEKKLKPVEPRIRLIAESKELVSRAFDAQRDSLNRVVADLAAAVALEVLKARKEATAMLREQSSAEFSQAAEPDLFTERAMAESARAEARAESARAEAAVQRAARAEVQAAWAETAVLEWARNAELRAACQAGLKGKPDGTESRTHNDRSLPTQQPELPVDRGTPLAWLAPAALALMFLQLIVLLAVINRMVAVPLESLQAELLQMRSEQQKHDQETQRTKAALHKLEREVAMLGLASSQPALAEKTSACDVGCFIAPSALEHDEALDFEIFPLADRAL